MNELQTPLENTAENAIGWVQRNENALRAAVAYTIMVIAMALVAAWRPAVGALALPS